MTLTVYSRQKRRSPGRSPALKVHPVHIVNALNCGFDGVLGVVCSPDDCKMQQDETLQNVMSA